MPSNHLVLCCPLPLLPSIFPNIRVFSNELALCIRWPKYWSFSSSIGPSNEYSGLISFRMDWLDLLAVQWDCQESSPTPQFKSINSLALSLLYGPTLTSYMTTGKTLEIILLFNFDFKHSVPQDGCDHLVYRCLEKRHVLRPQTRAQMWDCRLEREGISIPWCSRTQAIPRELPWLTSKWCFHMGQTSGLGTSYVWINSLCCFPACMSLMSSVCFSLVIKKSLFWQQ